MMYGGNRAGHWMREEWILGTYWDMDGIARGNTSGYLKIKKCDYTFLCFLTKGLQH